jgi:hypothetical protein
MTVGGLRVYLKEQWPRIKEELLKGDYIPKPVRAGRDTEDWR